MKQLIVIIALGLNLVLFSQENEDLYILEADSTWLKEIIKFPLSFAKSIDYEGYEDLRFAKNWSNPEGSEFFTYAFVWNINLNSLPSLEIIETNMKLYYNGLMTTVNKDKDFKIPSTELNFEEIKSDSDLPIFKGKVNVYDSFFTKEIIQLYVNVRTIHCNNRYLLMFRVSTQNYNNIIWDKLNEVKLKDDFCQS